jgi:hypothetical protein
MAFVVKEDESPNPIDVRFFRSFGIVQQSALGAYLIQQLGFVVGELRCLMSEIGAHKLELRKRR